MQAILIFLFLALPACGQVVPPVDQWRPPGRYAMPRGGVAIDTLEGPGLVWVTIRVDSLNLGTEHGAWTDAEWVGSGWMREPGDSTRWHGAPAASFQIWRRADHDWVYSHERFRSRAQLPPEPPLDDPEMWMWTERERERICRICLRHEFQAEKVIPPKPVLSPFDSLKALLRRPSLFHPVLGPIEPISPEAERVPTP